MDKKMYQDDHENHPLLTYKRETCTNIEATELRI